MAVITELSRSALERALQDYDVGPLIAFRPVAEGIENTNYFVRTAGSSESQSAAEEYVLTLIESEDTTVEDRTLMVSVLDACHDHGLPVAPVLRTRSGSIATEIEFKPAILSPRLAGRHTAVPVQEQCEAVGRFLARMHAVTDSVDCETRPYIRDTAWLAQCREIVFRHLSYSERELLAQAVDQISAMLARNDVSKLPQGVIHGDLFRDNALFNEYGLSGVVDFHHTSRGYWIYDVAVAVNDWCRDRDALNVERTMALLGEYHEQRAFTPAELWFFSTFLLYGAVAFWLSRLLVAVRDDLPESYPVKDPNEFAELVARHLTAPFRVDPLLFS